MKLFGKAWRPCQEFWDFRQDNGNFARNQKENAVYVSQEEAIKLLPNGADETCIILEVDGKAAAYPDSQVLRPHVINAAEVAEDVVLTYCGLSNLGIAYTPKLGGKPLDLHPMTQMENNLVMYDRNSMEPVQQLWGTTESRMECQCGLNNVERMKEWPTYRMTLQQFCKAWPGSKVFMNDYSTKGLKTEIWQNPIIFIYDGMMDLIFNSSIVYQKTNEKPVFPTLKTKDNRLPNKENVYVVPVEGDDVAYTKAFLQEKNSLTPTSEEGKLWWHTSRSLIALGRSTTPQAKQWNSWTSMDVWRMDGNFLV